MTNDQAKEEREDIGFLIQMIRKQEGLSAYALAKKAGIGLTRLRSVESGRTAYTVDSLIRVCDALGTELVFKLK